MIATRVKPDSCSTRTENWILWIKIVELIFETRGKYKRQWYDSVKRNY